MPLPLNRNRLENKKKVLSANCCKRIAQKNVCFHFFRKPQVFWKMFSLAETLFSAGKFEKNPWGALHLNDEIAQKNYFQYFVFIFFTNRKFFWKYFLLQERCFQQANLKTNPWSGLHLNDETAQINIFRIFQKPWYFWKHFHHAETSVVVTRKFKWE